MCLQHINRGRYAIPKERVEARCPPCLCSPFAIMLIVFCSFFYSQNVLSFKQIKSNRRLLFLFGEDKGGDDATVDAEEPGIQLEPDLALGNFVFSGGNAQHGFKVTFGKLDGF